MYLSDMFLTQNDLEKEALLPLLFNIALEYAIRKVHEKSGGNKIK
jgi:hypothetical protein